MAGKCADFQISKPLLFLCEGPADAAFVREALNHGNCTTAYDVDIAKAKDSLTGEMRPGGIDALVETLFGYRGQTNFKSLRHVVMVIDSDADAGQNVIKIRDKIIAKNQSSGKRKFAVPATQRVRVRSNDPNTTDTTLICIPFDSPGCLETIYLNAARIVHANISIRANQFAIDTGAAVWPSITKKHKMLLRSIIAAGWEDEPDIGVGNLWRGNRRFLPISAPEFQPLVTYLCQQTA